MKFVHLLSSVTVLVFSFQAYSETQLPSRFEAEAVPLMKKSVLQSFEPILQKDSCPEGGSQDFDRVAEDLGSALSSSKIVISLIEKAQPQLTELNQETGRCGACQQINQTAVFTTTEVDKTTPNDFCNNKETVHLQKEMPTNDVQTFVSDTLKGKTDEGKKLYVACPDPCSFNIASATTESAKGQSLLNLTVLCGQPRAQNILFAKYKFSSGLIHKWSCQ